MREGWKYVTLPEISKNLDNFRKPVTKSKREEGIYPYYGASGIVDYVDGYLYNEDILLISEDGANLLARTTPIAFSVRGKVWVNNHAHVLSFPSLVQQRFVEYYFSFIDISDYVTGAAQPKLSQKNLNSIPIPAPFLSEQQSIVAHLDASFAEIDALKAKAAEEVANGKAMFDAALKEEMTPKEGWEEKTLKDLSLIAGNYGLSVPSCKYNGVRYLRITDITDWGELNNEFVSADIESTDNQIELQEGDILFARTGATVGKTLVYSRLMGLCVFAGYLIRYRIDCNKILPRYMFYETHSPWYFKWVKKNQQAAAQPNISAKLYNTYLVKYPSIEIQQRIVAKLDTLRSHLTELEQKYNLIAANCDALKQAILRETFE